MRRREDRVTILANLKLQYGKKLTAPEEGQRREDYLGPERERREDGNGFTNRRPGNRGGRIKERSGKGVKDRGG